MSSAENRHSACGSGDVTNPSPQVPRGRSRPKIQLANLPMEIIRLENCRVQLGEVEVPVLKGISFSIQRGGIGWLMGASGPGKAL